MHNDHAAGHLRINKTLGRIMERFYWLRVEEVRKELVSQLWRLCIEKILSPIAAVFVVGDWAERVAVNVMDQLLYLWTRNQVRSCYGELFH